MRSMTLEWHIPRPRRTAGGNCNPYANGSWERASGNRQAENKAQGGVVGAARMEVVAGRDLQALCSSPSLVQSLRARRQPETRGLHFLPRFGFRCTAAPG